MAPSNPPGYDELQRLIALRDRLMAEIDTRNAELGRVHAAIGAQQALLAEARGEAHRGTYKLIRAYIGTLPPDTPIDVDVLLAWMEEKGWESAAWKRRRALLCALAVLTKRKDPPEVARTGWGEYQTLPAGHRGKADAGR